MLTVKVRFEIVTLKEGFGFRLMNLRTHEQIFESPFVYSTITEVEAQLEKLTKILMESRLGECEINEDGTISITAEPRTFEYLSKAFDKTEIIVVAELVTDNTTGKYGALIATNAGLVLMEPLRWFDTAEEAMTYMRNDQELKDRIAEVIKEKLGPGKAQFMSDAPTYSSKEELEAHIAKMKNKDESKELPYNLNKKSDGSHNWN